MQVDFLIEGHGICGTLLSHELLQAGASVLVIDQPNPAAASRVASGIINPVTGKRLVKTWMYEELLEVAKETYAAIGQEAGKVIAKQTSIYNFFTDVESRAMFAEKSAGAPEYLHLRDNLQEFTDVFNYSYGCGEIRNAMLVDIHAILMVYIGKLLKINSLINEFFDWGMCVVEDDRVSYKDIEARYLICCDGVVGGHNPYFYALPWSDDKGEAFIVHIPNLPAAHIYKYGVHITPWHDGRYWVGAAHMWQYDHTGPTPAYRQAVEEQLRSFLHIPFTIEEHMVSLRPANMERKPFVGMHPKYPRVGILGGMGSKGCSLAPYFARQLTDHLLNGTPILPEANVQRHRNILNRQ